MIIIPIKVLANQRFSTILDDNEWNITLRTASGITAVSMVLNNVQVIENMRAVANTKIIPSIYQESGNFIFLTKNYELPEYTKFGINQFLVYASQAELDALRPSTPTRVTEQFFNPIASLPLRFKPQGYT